MGRPRAIRGADSHALALTVQSMHGGFMVHMMFNAYWEQLQFAVSSVPELSGGSWRRWIDTFLESPADICSWDEAAAVREAVYAVQPRSLAVLAGRIKNEMNM